MADIKEPEFDLTRRSLLERYKMAMNSSVKDKLDRILPPLKRYRNMDPSEVLSVGAGTGKLEAFLAQELPHTQLICLDLDLEMLETIRDEEIDVEEKDIKNLQLVQGRAGDNLPFASSKLEGVVASSVVHEIASYSDGHEFGPKVRNFFQESARVLDSGGRLIVRDFIQPRHQISLTNCNGQAFQMHDQP